MAPNQLTRQPPADTLWVQHHPWMEGLVGHLAAWGLHLGVIGVGLLVVLAYALGFIKHNTALPVEPVTIMDAGGNLEEDNNDNSVKPGPPNESPGEKSNSSNNTVAPPAERPPLSPALLKRADEEFTPPDARFIKDSPPDVTSPFIELERDAREKFGKGVDPPRSIPGPGAKDGKGPGDGPGNGKVLNPREKRMLRWSMKFNTSSGEDYLGQLRGLGADLAIPVGPDQYKVIDLSKGPPFRLEDRDLTTIQRIWWTDNTPASIRSLMAAMRLPIQPPRVVAFIPPELEDDLAKKELAFKGLTEDEIYETKFEVVNAGGRYDVRVFDQTKK